MFKPEPNLPNMNIVFMFVFTSCLNQTSRFKFRFGPRTPEPEPNQTPASLFQLLKKVPNYVDTNPVKFFTCLTFLYTYN